MGRGWLLFSEDSMRYSFALLVKLKNKRVARTRITFSVIPVPDDNK